jgi:hypothetical protein
MYCIEEAIITCTAMLDTKIDVIADPNIPPKLSNSLDAASFFI